MTVQNNDYVNEGKLLQDIDLLIERYRVVSELCADSGLGDNARFDEEEAMADTAINHIRFHGFGQEIEE